MIPEVNSNSCFLEKKIHSIGLKQGVANRVCSFFELLFGEDLKKIIYFPNKGEYFFKIDLLKSRSIKLIDSTLKVPKKLSLTFSWTKSSVAISFSRDNTQRVYEVISMTDRSDTGVVKFLKSCVKSQHVWFDVVFKDRIIVTKHHWHGLFSAIPSSESYFKKEFNLKKIV